MTRSKLQRALMAAFLIPVLALAACAHGDEANAESQAAPETRPHNVRVLELRASDLVETLVLSGRLEAQRATDVSTEESGVVQALPVEKGELVRKGQVLVLLDRGLLDAEKKSAEASVTLRSYNEERTRSLYEANSVSKQEMLRVYTELQQAEQNAKIAQLRHERAAIKAPFDGVLVERNVELGQFVNPGTPVARVVDPFALDLVGSVTEREVSYLSVGSPAIVSVDGVDAVVSATVSYVSVEASPINGKFTVEIRVENPDLVFRAGVVARARVLKKIHQEILAIPRDAVVRTMEGETVFVVEDDRAVPRLVRLGKDQGMMVVVESGVELGDQIVVRGQRQLQANATVSVREVATARDGSVATDPAEVREAGNLEGLRDMRSEERLRSTRELGGSR